MQKHDVNNFRIVNFGSQKLQTQYAPQCLLVSPSSPILAQT